MTENPDGNMLYERFDLPFDLYTRNRIISDLIYLLRKNKECLKILDIGGRSGHLKDFLQEDDDLYVLDIQKSEFNEKNYFVGDIISGPFKDRTFDVVVSSDLFEHISPENRETTLSEMLRISKNFVILGAPFYSEKATEAEIKINEFFRKLTGNNHQWLSEHIKNGLPSAKKLETFFKNNGFDYLTMETNNISNWLLMQLFIFYSYKYGIPSENVSKVYRFYNENFLELGDTLSPAYRTIFLIGRMGTLPKVDFKSKSRIDRSKYHALETLIFEVIGQLADSRDNHIHSMEAVIQDESKHIKILGTVVQEKDNYINGLETTIKNLDSSIAENNRKLNDIYSSTIWQLLTKYQKLVDTVLPYTTKRRHVYDLAIIGVRVIANDGFSTFVYKLNERLFTNNLNASKVPIVETKIVSPHVPLSLAKSLRGKFTFLSDNLKEIKIYTATNNRLNSDLTLYITNAGGNMLRKTTVKGHRIQENGYTSFGFKPIKDSKGVTFFFELMSKKEPCAVAWYNESITLPELTLYYNDEPINGNIGFQAFADIGIKSRYDLWILKNEPTAAKLEQYKKEIIDFEYHPKISILTPVYNPDVAWIEAAIESVRRQVYENWELCLADASTKKDVRKCLEAYAAMEPRIKVKFLPENKGISENSNEALALATGEYIGLLDHDDEVSPDGLYEVVKYLQTNRYADMIYSDEDKIDLKGNRRDPFFKPDWSPDTFLSCMYTCHFGVYKKKIIDEIGGFREGYNGSQDYDLVLRVMDKTGSIYHIPKILYHWRAVHGSTASAVGAKSYAYVAAKKALTDYMTRNNIDGDVSDGFWTGSYRMKRELAKMPLISILIVSSDTNAVEKCINSIEQATNFTNYEIIIIGTGNQEDAIDKNSVHTIQYSGSYNISAARNLAASHAKGEYLLFLDENVKIITNDWVNVLLEHAQRPEVGAVGTKLVNSSNQILHCGITLGLGKHKVGGYPLSGFPSNIPGYFGNITIVKNCSAVTAACMMLRKDVFNEINGFDEHLTVAFNDIDLCLKLRQKGYLIVYTPYAELYYHGLLNRDYKDAPELQKLFLKDVEYMREKWGKVIDEGDSYYNPNLTLDREDCSIRI